MFFNVSLSHLFQFRYKTRVYKQTNLDEKQLAKLHTKVKSETFSALPAKMKQTKKSDMLSKV